jgi:hypothetical protein
VGGVGAFSKLQLWLPFLLCELILFSPQFPLPSTLQSPEVVQQPKNADGLTGLIFFFFPQQP